MLLKAHTLRASAAACVTLVAAWLAQAVPAHAAPADLEQILQSVVSVFPEWRQGRFDVDEPEGSGVVVLDGKTIVTALHVLEAGSGGGGADRAHNVRIRSYDGVIMEAAVASFDEATDLALLTIEEALPALPFGGDARVGEEACSLGNAFGLGLSLTCGHVSAIHRAGVGFNAVEDFVQTDAAVNPGASGGALVSADGELIGILSAIFTKTSDANIGVNFAVSAPLAERVVQDLAASGQVTWNFAGAGLAQHPQQGESGTLAAEIIRVRAGSAAENSGLLEGDLITHALGVRVRSPEQFRGLLARHRAGDSLEVRVIRGDKTLTLTLTLE